VGDAHRKDLKCITRRGNAVGAELRAAVCVSLGRPKVAGVSKKWIGHNTVRLRFLLRNSFGRCSTEVWTLKP
jgi:hypothetical protein